MSVRPLFLVKSRVLYSELTTYRASADWECLHYANHFLSAQTGRDQSMSIPIPSANQCHSLSNRTRPNRKAVVPQALHAKLGRPGVSEILPHILFTTWLSESRLPDTDPDGELLFVTAVQGSQPSALVSCRSKLGRWPLGSAPFPRWKRSAFQELHSCKSWRWSHG